MTPEELEAIAQRQTTCHPFGETVSISRAERDALVQWTRRAMFALPDAADREVPSLICPIGTRWGMWGENTLYGEELYMRIDAEIAAKEQS